MSKRRPSYLLLSLASGSVAAAATMPACGGSDTSDNSKTPDAAHAGSAGAFQGSVVMPPTAGATVVVTGVVVMPPNGGTGPCGGGVCGTVALPPGGEGGGGEGGHVAGGPCNGHPCGVVINPGGGAGGAPQFPGLIINPGGGAGGDGGAPP